MQGKRITKSSRKMQANPNQRKYGKAISKIAGNVTYNRASIVDYESLSERGSLLLLQTSRP
jgi:hypothetical protein